MPPPKPKPKAKQPTLTERLGRTPPEPTGPRPFLWDGPQAPGPNGGITFSMLTRFLSCRERFRVAYLEGLRPVESFSHRMEYGNLWHVCEEALAADATRNGWRAEALKYAKGLAARYPLQRAEVDKWLNVCLVQFPVYVDYWAKHADVTARTPVFQEQVFDVPYPLPSGRTVRLRGKFDSVDVIGTEKEAGIYLQENKTKGDVDQLAMQRQLTNDLQTMIYLTALSLPAKSWHSGPGRDAINWPYGTPVKGVRYNVVRRPLSGGKGNIKQLGPSKANPAGETADEYYARLARYFTDDPGYWFMRWKTDVLPHDLKRFQERTLTPVLEQLCDWYEWVSKARDPFSPNDGCEAATPDGDRSVYSSIHWMHPHGSVNHVDAYGAGDTDEFIQTGSEAGLTRRKKLFTELQ